MIIFGMFSKRYMIQYSVHYVLYFLPFFLDPRREGPMNSVLLVSSHGSEVRLRIVGSWLVGYHLSQVTTQPIFLKFGIKLDIDK